MISEWRFSDTIHIKALSTILSSFLLSSGFPTVWSHRGYNFPLRETYFEYIEYRFYLDLNIKELRKIYENRS